MTIRHWQINWSKHPYLTSENRNREYDEWENDPNGNDRYGRHHETFGCYWDWMDRKLTLYKRDPRIALADAEYVANQNGTSVWECDALNEMIREVSSEGG